MASKKKHDILIKVSMDSRECITDYAKDLIDARVGKDGIKIVEVITEAVKPLDINTGKPCSKSTGDIGIYYKIANSDDEWKLSNLSIEIKKKDLFSSLYTKANRDRLYAELLRAKEYGLDFYFVNVNSLHDTIQDIKKVKKLAYTNCEVTHFDQLVDLNKKLAELGHNPIIVSGKSLAWTIRRIIKRHIKLNKLQYI